MIQKYKNGEYNKREIVSMAAMVAIATMAAIAAVRFLRDPPRSTFSAINRCAFASLREKYSGQIKILGEPQRISA